VLLGPTTRRRSFWFGNTSSEFKEPLKNATPTSGRRDVIEIERKKPLSSELPQFLRKDT